MQNLHLFPFVCNFCDDLIYHKWHLPWIAVGMF